MFSEKSLLNVKVFVLLKIEKIVIENLTQRVTYKIKQIKNKKKTEHRGKIKTGSH